MKNARARQMLEVRHVDADASAAEPMEGGGLQNEPRTHAVASDLHGATNRVEAHLAAVITEDHRETGRPTVAHHRLLNDGDLARVDALAEPSQRGEQALQLGVVLVLG